MLNNIILQYSSLSQNHRTNLKIETNKNLNEKLNFITEGWLQNKSESSQITRRELDPGIGRVNWIGIVDSIAGIIRDRYGATLTLPASDCLFTLCALWVIWGIVVGIVMWLFILFY